LDGHQKTVGDDFAQTWLKASERAFFYRLRWDKEALISPQYPSAIFLDSSYAQQYPAFQPILQSPNHSR
jgi:hypothetical protein